MLYWVNKNGQQIGPYTFEQISSFVRESAIDKEDLCWKEGWADWKYISTLLAGTNHPSLTATECETEIFIGNPSLVPVLFEAMIWLIISPVFFLLALAPAFLGQQMLQIPTKTLVILVMVSFFAYVSLRLGTMFIKTKGTQYIVSSSRIKIISGILSRNIEEIELHRIQDMSLQQPFVYRLFNLGSIQVISVDRTDPVFTIKLIKNSEDIREKLRTAVLVRKKKENIREVQMF